MEYSCGWSWFFDGLLSSKAQTIAPIESPCDDKPGGGSNGGGGGNGGGNNDSGPPHNDSGHTTKILKTIIFDPEYQEEEEDACDEIAAQIANPAFDAKMDELEGKTSLQQETGYSQKTSGSFDSLQLNGNDGLDIPDPLPLDIIGYMHTHIDDYPTGKYNEAGQPEIKQSIKIFSPKDIKTFLKMVVNAHANNIPIENVYGMVITSSGNYMLRFTGNISDVNTNFNPDYLEDSYKKYFDRYTNKERAFLKFMEDKIPTQTGIRLYKIKNNGTIKEKFLNEYGNFDSETCE